MTLAELLTKVRDYVDEESEESWSDERLKRLIQTASNEVSAIVMALNESYYVQDHSTGLLIQPNTELYDLADNFLRLKSLMDENGIPLTKKNASKRNDYIGTGSVRYYYFQGTKIGILDIPTSSATFPYKFVRTPTQMTLTSDTAVPDVPEYLCHDFIAVKAAMLALGIDEDDDTWLNKQANFLFKQIQETYFRRNSDYPDEAPNDPDLELD